MLVVLCPVSRLPGARLSLHCDSAQLGLVKFRIEVVLYQNYYYHFEEDDILSQFSRIFLFLVEFIAIRISYC